MGPKKGKDVTNEDYWKTFIEDSLLNDEHWEVKVILIEAAGSEQDRKYLNSFESYAAEDKRFVIKNISKTETTFMINQLGGDKKVKDDNLKVFEAGESYLKEKKDIPPDVWALIIKHLILKMKDEYLFIKRQRLEVREGMRAESITMVGKDEVRGSVNVKLPDAVSSSPDTKVKKNKGEPEPVVQSSDETEGKKYNTVLRVRGEEWRDKIYIDDFPNDGPNIYVALTGFIEPFLPVYLIKIGVPLTAVIQVRIESTLSKVPSYISKHNKKGSSQTEMLLEKSINFWDHLQNLRIDNSASDELKNTAFIIFSPSCEDLDQLVKSPEKIYDEICFLMYDVQDLTRQHVHYLENMRIINIPDYLNNDCRFEFYTKKMQGIPLECLTVYSVMDSILVSIDENLNNNIQDGSISTKSLSSSITKNANIKSIDISDKVARAEHLVKRVFGCLNNITDETKKTFRVTYGHNFENLKEPAVIQYGDKAKYSTFHLGNIDLENIIWRSLYNMPYNLLWRNHNKSNGQITEKNNVHVNILLSCLKRDDIEVDELNRLIYILSFRKLYNDKSSQRKKQTVPSNITNLKKTYLKRSILAEPLSQAPKNINSTSTLLQFQIQNENSLNDSKEGSEEICCVKSLFDFPDICGLVSATEIANEEPIIHVIDDYEYFEDFTGNNASQVMHEAFNNFNCVDYKYCEITDSILLMFFNSHDENGIAREQWRSHIPTPVCLQDFFDFVLEENYDWIENEERIYVENIIVQSKSIGKDANILQVGKSCIGNIEDELDLLIEGSIKYKEIAKIEEITEISDTNATTNKSAISPTSNEDSKSSKKSKSSTPKQTRKIFTVPEPDSYTSLNTPAKPFHGYNLGERRLESFGQNCMFYSKDGTRVLTKYSMLIPNNIEFVALNIAPGNGYNEFWLYKALDTLAVTSEVTDVCESFRITTKGELFINIRKRTFQIPEMKPMNFISDPYSKNNINNSNYENNVGEIQSKNYYSFTVTWPNGLITESVHDNNSEISHIKQFYLNPTPNHVEDMRCISIKGEVIIFKSSGIIDVLYPDGSIVTITNCRKEMVQPINTEDIQSNASSEKSGKDKKKGKEKNRKSSLRLSKSTIIDDNISETNPPEYELFIHEYETIDNNGVKEQWINGKPIFIEKFMSRTATDHCLPEVFTRRMDGTNILLNKNGDQVVTFPDKTRIITNYFIDEEEIYPEWTDEEVKYFNTLNLGETEMQNHNSQISMSPKSCTEIDSKTDSFCSYRKYEQELEERCDGYISVQISFTIEHEKFSSVIVDKAHETISVISPNNTQVTVDINNNYNMTLDDKTTAIFDGKTLNINYVACAKCDAKTTIAVSVNTEEVNSGSSKINNNWLEMCDSFDKHVEVDEEGNIFTSNQTYTTDTDESYRSRHGEECVSNEIKSEATEELHEDCKEMSLAKSTRFIVLHRDLSCSELIHRDMLDQYIQNCRGQPWCSINEHDTFADHRSLVSILTPVHVTESEKWLMESKLADKPHYLKYKDLKEDAGKGFYHWMRPYDRFVPQPRKPNKVLPPRLPRAYILRTLEKQWNDSERHMLSGAKELICAILEYRKVVKSNSEALSTVPIKDPRSAEEKCIDDNVQKLAHRIYEDLRNRITEQVAKAAKADITTLPPAASIAMLPGPRGIDSDTDESYDSQAPYEASTLVKQLEAAETMRPSLQRYWRRREQEVKEDEFYMHLLRDGGVPPYFRNVLGGAVWWEVNSAVEDATRLGEETNVTCACISDTSQEI
ncbi:hypothetical protein ACJJTC_008146 [Scirpophaga incertulas]